MRVSAFSEENNTLVAEKSYRPTLHFLLNFPLKVPTPTYPLENAVPTVGIVARTNALRDSREKPLVDHSYRTDRRNLRNRELGRRLLRRKSQRKFDCPARRRRSTRG